MDADLASGPDDGTGKDRGSGGEKRPRLDHRAVDVRMGPDQHVVAEAGRCQPAAAHKRVLHYHRPLADIDAAVLGREDGAEQDPRARADMHITGQDRVRGHVGRRIDGGLGISMLDQHAVWPSRVAGTPNAPAADGQVASGATALGEPPAVRSEWSNVRPVRANIGSGGASPVSQRSISSARAGPCLKPWPEPPPSNHMFACSG